ncbi:uncharacterized protein LOC129580665 [Paramacrobiotus metropolitanus]|uniref:uncharacterized protein LOC129580665 n=1 Tax=Paramacrobiotus metropolitanus TaxID=2943436 RepID=UPI002445A4D8|nr:uncharacterized protein LOC129580665 [Paramacrobiotus metropolitanus]
MLTSRKVPFAAFFCIVCVCQIRGENNSTSESKNDTISFFCQYYSDHSMSCYDRYRIRNVNDTLETEASDKAFAIIGLGDSTKGTWTNDDGFFQMGNDSATGDRHFLGSCMFDTNDGANCAGAPPPCDDDKMKTTGCVDGAMFRALAFSGRPGGQIKAVLPVGFPA